MPIEAKLTTALSALFLLSCLAQIVFFITL